MPTTPTQPEEVNTGFIRVGPGDTATIEAGQLVNNGLVFVDGGALALNAQLTGAGVLVVANGGVADLTQIVGSGQTVFLGAGGTLELPDPHDFLATIWGWAPGGALALPHMTITDASYQSDVLTLHDGAFTEAQIRLPGAYTSSDFHISNGSDGTAVITIGRG
jgi:hypothetical protein